MKNVRENDANRSCSRWPCDPRQGQGLWKRYRMEEVYGAYKHGRYAKIWFNSLRDDN